MPLTLQLDPERVDAFCRRLAEHTPSPEQALAGLTAMQSFLADATGPAEQESEAYRIIRQSLASRLESVRDRLVGETAARLKTALAARDATAVAQIYRPLSRSGFWAALEVLAPRCTAAEMDEFADWAGEWMVLAKSKGEAASGYPDALDFGKAGIDVGEYVAMTDVATFLASHKTITSGFGR